MEELQLDFINRTANFEILVKNMDKSLFIPYYQRNYVWPLPSNSYVLKKFYDDIYEAFTENKKYYFIGNCAFAKSATNEIVDGQQRITSLIILIKTLNKFTKTDLTNYFYNSDGLFLINNDCELAKDLLEILFEGKMNKSCPVKYAVDVADKKIKEITKTATKEKLIEFETYLIKNVVLNYIEFDSSFDGLNHFLNINSLQVPLTESDVFYAYFSMLMKNVNNTTLTIDDVKANVQSAARTQNSKLSEEDIIYLFLRSYFKDDPNVGFLNADNSGVGRWMTGYQRNIFKDTKASADFISAFTQYAADITKIINFIVGNDNMTTIKYNQIYLNYLLNKYTGKKYIKEILLALFINRNSYRKTAAEKAFYDKFGNINMLELESYFKTANAAIVKSFIDDKLSNKEILDCLLNSTKKKTKISEILSLCPYENIFGYNYSTLDNEIQRKKIKNKKEIIHLILAIQEAYLNHIADPSFTMNTILTHVLNTESFTIEHLYSKIEFFDSARCNEWTNKGTFTQDYEFDSVRSNFRNLSLMSRRENSTAKDATMSDKLKIYASCNAITDFKKPEYLLQSLVAGSSFYTNPNIQALNLPNRAITLDTNPYTWEHAKMKNNKGIEIDANEEFNRVLTKLAVEELFK